EAQAKEKNRKLHHYPKLESCRLRRSLAMQLRTLVSCLIVLLPALALAHDGSSPKRRFQATEKVDAERWQQDSRRLIFDFLKMTDLERTRHEPAQAIAFDVKTLRKEDRGTYDWSELELASTKTRRIKVVLTIPKPRADVPKFPAIVAI